MGLLGYVITKSKFGINLVGGGNSINSLRTPQASPRSVVRIASIICRRRRGQEPWYAAWLAASGSQRWGGVQLALFAIPPSCS